MGDTVNRTFLKKAEFIWRDKRSYKKRLLIASVTLFSLCYTFVFFGPIELTAFGQDSLTFNVSDILLIMACTSILIFIVSSLLIALLRGRIFNYIVTGLFSLTICGYIQGNFLNGSLGALTGDEIAWHTQRGDMLINLLIWFIIFIIPYIVLYFNNKNWKNMIFFVSFTIVIMQTVALVTIFINSPSDKKEVKNDYYLTTNNMFEYSKEDNTLVFLLDRLDYDYIQQVMDEDPEFFNQLDGFTNYTNAISEHGRTRPAANYMMTNCDDLLFKVPSHKYFEDSWNYKDKNILKDMNNAKYKTNIYTQISDMLGSGKSVENYVSNISVNNKHLDIMGVTSELVSLSIYRYSPTSIKPFFWTYTDYVNNNAYIKDKDNERYEIDETKYLNGINEITATDSDKNFKFYHFNGSHPPYVLDENGNKSSNPTNVVQQTKGSFNILFKAFKKMKDLGIYKDASIIIVADHGDAVSDKEPLKKPTRIGLFYKQGGVEGANMKSSVAPVSLKNIPATILKSSGVNYEKYGIPLDEVKEDSDIIRKFYKTVMKDGHEKELYTYEVSGNASDFDNWKKTDVTTIEYPYY
ncbi:MAG: sulfatase-like hydrolase/transferase [Coprobacillus sp.]